MSFEAFCTFVGKSEVKLHYFVNVHFSLSNIWQMPGLLDVGVDLKDMCATLNGPRNYHYPEGKL